MSLPVEIDWSDLNDIVTQVIKKEPHKQIKSSIRKETRKVDSGVNNVDKVEPKVVEYKKSPIAGSKQDRKIEKAEIRLYYANVRSRNATLLHSESSEDEDAANLFDQLSSEEADGANRKVTFYYTVVVLNDPDKRWNSKIENEKKGKFSPEEEQALLDSIVRYCNYNDIPKSKMEYLIASQDNPARSERMWSTICSVLPRRSIQSCFRFVKRRFNRNNYKGEWTVEEAEELRVLYDKLGPKWKAIAEQLHRTAENVRDKMYSMSSETPYLPFWSMLETVRLVRLVQEQFDDEFAETAGTLVCYLVLELLEKEAPQHDNAESEQRKKNRKYNSNTFVFHNLAALMGALKFDVMKTLDFDLLKWRGIANHIPTKSKDQCRTKWRQIVGLQYIAFSPTTKYQDYQLIAQIVRQKPESEEYINFELNNGKNSEYNKQRWRVLKKFVEGRLKKSFAEVLQEVQDSVSNHPRLQSKKPRLNFKYLL